MGRSSLSFLNSYALSLFWLKLPTPESRLMINMDEAFIFDVNMASPTQGCSSTHVEIGYLGGCSKAWIYISYPYQIFKNLTWPCIYSTICLGIEKESFL